MYDIIEKKNIRTCGGIIEVLYYLPGFSENIKLTDSSSENL